MTKREMWNDSMGLVLCISGLIGCYAGVPHAGWLIFFGFLFFCESGSKDKP